MNNINSIGFALDPTNTPSFLLDWELTKLCNLDCSYCGHPKMDPLDLPHDNTSKHPPKEECLRTIDFMYEYVDQYMQYKKPSQRKVILNVYGGESLFHPDIVEILTESRARYEKYKNNWHLTITCTTNGVVGKSRWEEVVPLVDEFTLSFHSESLPKQQEQYLDNLIYLKNHNKRVKAIIMMHNNPALFEISESMIEFCRTNKINFVAKPLDGNKDKWNYTQKQFDTLKTFWINAVAVNKQADYTKSLSGIGTSKTINSVTQGRACCGGRKMSINGDLKSSVSFVPAQGFRDWYCSVNWFFLFVRQLDGAVYTNKDCKTSTTGQVEPLGFLDNSQEIINTLVTQLSTQNMPIIQCVKDICMCGFCAPKAETKSKFENLIKQNVPVDVFVKSC
jgi:pyruvate-formate lyase-activating enzyme